MKDYILIVSTLFALMANSRALATDWIAAPSTFTHDPKTGQRTVQFAPIPPVHHMPLYGRSAYRQARSSLQVGDSMDQYHVVEKYGDPIRPYGEWRYPFRPFSVPNHLWASPYGGNGSGAYGYGGLGYGGLGFGGGIGSPFGPFGAINGAGFPPPWNDGSYPDVLRKQTPPQKFNPGFNATTNNLNGNNHHPATTNHSPTNTVTGNNHNVTNN